MSMTVKLDCLFVCLLVYYKNEIPHFANVVWRKKMSVDTAHTYGD